MQNKKGIKKTVFVLVLVVLFFISVIFWKIIQPRSISREEMQINGLIYFEQPREITEFSLTDHRGKAFTRANLEGKWTMVFPGFTNCPDICPTTMAQLATMWGHLGKESRDDLQVVMLSVDPNRDSVEKLAAYVPYFNEGFIGLTGPLNRIANLASQLNVAFDIVNPENAPETYDVAHSANIVLISPQGHYQGFFKPPFDPALLRLNFRSVRAQH